MYQKQSAFLPYQLGHVCCWCIQGACKWAESLRRLTVFIPMQSAHAPTCGGGGIAAACTPWAVASMLAPTPINVRLKDGHTTSQDASDCSWHCKGLSAPGLPLALHTLGGDFLPAAGYSMLTVTLCGFLCGVLRAACRIRSTWRPCAVLKSTSATSGWHRCNQVLLGLEHDARLGNRTGTPVCHIEGCDGRLCLLRSCKGGDLCCARADLPSCMLSLLIHLTRARLIHTVSSLCCECSESLPA
jgi:hypothetical protein